MRILLSNDDGVYAKGLRILHGVVSEFGETIVMAPDRNRSGASNSLTLANPLRVKQIENGFHSVEGTPTDCVHLALTGYFDELPDIVISGINDGSNLGDDILYSGTVAAATEGRNLGLPAIAISLVGDKYYETAGGVVRKLLQQLMFKPLGKNTVLNVNVPDVPVKELRGMEVTRLGSRHLAEPVVRGKDPRGHELYWVGPAGPESDAGPGTDFHAIANNFASITPLTFDLTDYKLFDELALWNKDVKVNGD